MKKDWRDAWHRYFQTLSSRKHTTQQIAVGFAIGTAVGLLPTFGLGFLVGIVALFFYPKMGKLSLFGALALWNPLILFPFQVASFALGRLLFGLPVIMHADTIKSVLTFHAAQDLIIQYLVGNLIITVVGTTIAYFAARGVVDAYRARRARHHDRARFKHVDKVGEKKKK